MKRTRKVQKLSLLRESQFCKENYSEKRPFLQEYTVFCKENYLWKSELLQWKTKSLARKTTVKSQFVHGPLKGKLL